MANRLIVAICLASFLGLTVGCGKNPAPESQQNDSGNDQPKDQSSAQKKNQPGVQKNDQQFVSADSIAESAQKMRLLLLALHTYHDDQKRFPAAYSFDKAGKPLLSWRVHLLPYLDQKDLYAQFHLDEPWDSSHNQKLIEKMPEVFRTPGSLADKGKTIFRGIGGEAGMFRVPSQPNSILGNKMATVLDGTVNTAMIVETTDALAIEWTRPGVLAPGSFDLTELFGRYSGGTNIAFVDASVRFISDAITPKQLTLFLMKNDGGSLSNLEQWIKQQESQKETDPQSFNQRVKTEAGQLKELFQLSSKIEAIQLKMGALQAAGGPGAELGTLMEDRGKLQEAYYQCLDKVLLADPK